MCACACGWVRASVCARAACVCESYREKERETERETEREKTFDSPGLPPGGYLLRLQYPTCDSFETYSMLLVVVLSK